VADIAFGVGSLAGGVLLIVFRERFVEWVANRNRRYGIVKRHETAARLTAWFIGVTLAALGLAILLISIL
jgi:hypothetical protein